MPKTSTEPPPRVGILTVSDRSSSGERPDSAGPTLAGIVTAQGWMVTAQEILPDDRNLIVEKLSHWSDTGLCDVILTTGGTGFSPRDVTPEATRAVIQREAPGMAEAMRADSLKFTPHAMLSRLVTGIRNNTLIVNLPGNPKAAMENLHVILPVIPHAVQLLRASPDAEAGHPFHPST